MSIPQLGVDIDALRGNQNRFDGDLWI